VSSLPVPVASAGEALWGWERIRALVVDSVSSPHSRRTYARALDDFRDWSERAGASAFSRETVQAYRASLEARGLSPSSVNLHQTVLRKLAAEAAANQLLSHEVAASIAAVKGTRQKGARLGNWLTLAQAQALLKAPAGEGPRAKRDRALLALLVGCGLRRTELAELDVERMQQREGRWVLVDVKGKGSRLRSVPVPAWAKAAVDRWRAVALIASGRLFRAISQTGDVAEGLTPQAVYLVVREYAAQLGLSVAPHDLRRTFAKLAHLGRSPLEQIQLSLGHESILTTERYLGVRQNLADAPCDHLGIELEDG
jgi:site-specific recombinase XerD